MPYVVLALVIILFGITAAWVIITRNTFRSFLKINKEADSEIEYALTERYEAIVKLVEIADSLGESLDSITTIPDMLNTGSTVKEKEEFDLLLTDLQNSINSSVIYNPVIADDRFFKKQQLLISDYEERINTAKSAYNRSASVINQIKSTFPSDIVADFMGISTLELFSDGKSESQGADSK